MFCENCGKPIPDDSTACVFCGQTMAVAAEGGYAPPRAAASYSLARPPRSGPFLVTGIFRFILQALERGRVIRMGVALMLRVTGALVVLGGVYMVIEMLKMAFRLPTSGTIAGIVAAALLGGATFAVFQILFYRADSVTRLDDSPFTVMPIFSYLFRAWGEGYATFASTLGVAGCLFAWLSGMDPGRLIDQFLPLSRLLDLGGNGSFVAGLMFLISMLLLAFGVLILFYFLAESVLVIVDIALNVRVLVRSREA